MVEVKAMFRILLLALSLVLMTETEQVLRI
jgi:hypothetical protein